MSKKKDKNYKTLTSIIESVDTVVNIGATAAPVTLSVTVVGSIAVPVPAGITCALSLGNEAILNRIINKALLNRIINKHNINKQQIDKYQQTFAGFDDLNRKNLRETI